MHTRADPSVEIAIGDRLVQRDTGPGSDDGPVDRPDLVCGPVVYRPLDPLEVRCALGELKPVLLLFLLDEPANGRAGDEKSAREEASVNLVVWVPVLFGRPTLPQDALGVELVGVAVLDEAGTEEVLPRVLFFLGPSRLGPAEIVLKFLSVVIAEIGPRLEVVGRERDGFE